MKSFTFSLARMRNYKEQVLTKEKGTLTRLRQQRDQIESNIQNLEQYRRDAARAFNDRQRGGVSAYELTAHTFMMENAQRQIEGLHRELQKAEADVERQLKVVLAASQEVSALEKLEEKKREEYRYALSKEEELDIAELITSGLIRGAQEGQDEGRL